MRSLLDFLLRLLYLARFWSSSRRQKSILEYPFLAFKEDRGTHPPKNGLIALLFTTIGLMCSKYVSQNRNEAFNNYQWYKMLLNFIT